MTAGPQLALPDMDVPELPRVLVITLGEPNWTDCSVCGVECPLNLFAAVNMEGYFVEDTYGGEWAGVPVCQECHDAIADGRKRSYW